MKPVYRGNGVTEITFTYVLVQFLTNLDWPTKKD